MLVYFLNLYNFLINEFSRTTFVEPLIDFNEQYTADTIAGKVIMYRYTPSINVHVTVTY